MKIKSSKINCEKLGWLLSQPIDIKLELVSQHMEIIRIVVNSVIDQEVSEKAGERYCRSKPYDGRYSRWGFNPGSVQVGGQKIPILVPRVRDNESEQSAPLESYSQLRQLPSQNEEMIRSVLHGLSMRDYEKVIDHLGDSFGLSSGTVSRTWKARSKQMLEEFEKRKYSDRSFVAMFIDGKHLAGDQMVIALGIDEQGNKVPLGVVQTTTENSKAIGGMLSDLLDRDLKMEEGMLFIIDGSKGIRKAIQEVFGQKAVVQRCQWHKRENVISYLPEHLQKTFRNKLQGAYREESYQKAKARLMTIKKELELINRSAAKSLEEGLEETLTLHRLELHEDFQRSFTTTNCIENLNGRLNKYIGRVKHWQTSDQRHRWVVAGILEIEKTLRKVGNYKNLYKLKEKIRIEVMKEKINQAA